MASTSYGNVLLADIRNVLRRIDNVPARMSCLCDLSELIAERGENIRTSPRGTENNLKPSTLWNDEGTGLIIVRIAVRIWTDPFGLCRIIAW